MTRPAILQPGQSYTFTFRQYFEMAYEPEDILAEFGYTLQRLLLSLPQSTVDLDRLADLKTRIQESLPYISLTSEAARRELLIAPFCLTWCIIPAPNSVLNIPLQSPNSLKVPSTITSTLSANC